MSGRDKKMLAAVKKAFQSVRKILEEDYKFESEDEVLFQQLLVARIKEDADTGEGELETEVPSLYREMKKRMERLLPKVMQL